MHEFLREVGECIIIQEEDLQSEELGNGGLDGCDLVVSQIELLQGADGEDVLGDEGELAFGEVQLLLVGTLGVAQLDRELAHFEFS